METSKNLSDCLTRLVDPQLFTPLPAGPDIEPEDLETMLVAAIQTTQPTLIQLSTSDICYLQTSDAYCKHIFASFFAVTGALHTYCTLPHTTSGESPHFLVTGQDPAYAIDSLLPTLTCDLRNPKHGLVDVAQLQLAFGIVHCNTILA